MSTLLQDMMGLLKRRKEVKPKNDDLLAIARYKTSTERFKPSPNLLSELITVKDLMDLAHQDLSGYLLNTTDTFTGVLTMTEDAIVNDLTIGKGGGGIVTNTALGKSSLVNNTTGVLNTGVGYLSLSSNTEGYKNVGVGYKALNSNTTGDYNTAIGEQSLSHLSTGDSNTAIGRLSGFSGSGGALISSASDSVFLGHDSRPLANGQTNQIVIGSDAKGNGSNTATIGNANITDNYFIGNVRSNGTILTGDQDLSGYLLNTTDTFTGVLTMTEDAIVNGLTIGEGGGSIAGNSANGVDALKYNSSGVSLTAFGYKALEQNTTAVDNTAIGYDALSNATTGSENIAVGKGALLDLTTGSKNIALGNLALPKCNGDENVVIGHDALHDNTESGKNVVMGFEAGFNYSGSSSILIGWKAGISETGDNKLNIHNSDVVNPLIGGSFDTRELIFNGLISQESTGNSTYIGEDAGGSDDFTDRQNVGVGNAALLFNITGELNVGVGYASLLSNDSGSSHTAIGHGALSSMEVDSKSTAIGSFAFSNVEAAYDGVAIGSSAGAVDAVGADVVNADYSIFIGGSSKPKAEGNNNEIVIGAYAEGNGSNTATIGNTDVTELHLAKPGAALVLRSPNGTIYKISVSDAGAIVIV